MTMAGVENTFSRMVTTDANGTFEFAGLLPGEYKMTVELIGFRREEMNVPIAVNQRVRLDVDAESRRPVAAGRGHQTVPLLHVSDATVGEVIDQRQVAELPLNGRQFLELALLVPGAHTSHGAQMGDMNPLYWRPGQNSAITISGGRPNSNVYLLDGTVNTDPTFNTFVISLPPDAIREFQIQTGTYTAELGGAGTGQINVVTKVGHVSRCEARSTSTCATASSTRRSSPTPTSCRRSRRTSSAGHSAARPGRASSSSAGTKACGRRSTCRTSCSCPTWPSGSATSQRHAPIYDPLTNRPNPAFNPALPVSPANPQFIRDQFPGNKIPAEPDQLGRRSRCWRTTSCSRTATIRPTTISTRARTTSTTTATTSASIARGETARRSSAATA